MISVTHNSRILKKILPYAFSALCAQSAVAAIDFTRDVQPILNKNCIACHGGVKEAGEVSFIFRDQVLGKGESGKTVVVPGKPGISEMIARIITDDMDDLMPKPEHGPRLTDGEVSTLRQWISEGAIWGEHWSFVAPEKSPAPSVKNTAWPKNDIDRFILSKLESNDLTPNPEAKPSEWLRRASLDLTGLPPTITELDAFEAAAEDDLRSAIEKETDRLLASPRFGERWASVWQDLARYSDSEGLGMDGNRDVWKYRDWLIDAFNEDLPYDRFIIDQLAGDLLPDSTLDEKIATTFHRLTQANNEGGTDDEEFRVVAVMDRATTTWEAFQGISFGCVQCHSHPYDPIKHEEYYSFLSFFNNTADADVIDHQPLLRVPLDKTKYPAANQAVEDIGSLEEKIHQSWLAVDEATTWQPVTELKAESESADLSVISYEGFAEFRASDNAEAGSTYLLTAAPPEGLESLTAIRLTLLPKDEALAATDAEWGSVIKFLEVCKVGTDGKSQSVPLADVIADEPHPIKDPTDSLRKNGSGWGTFPKFYAARHATFVLKSPLALAPGETLTITLSGGGSYLSSFPLVPKRGRISLTSDPAWISHAATPGMSELKSQLATARKAYRSFPATTVPVMRERDPAHARITSVFDRGNWLTKGERIEASDTPHVFPELKSATEKPTRLDLAKWIASPENPLTARVAVNRFWLELFGIGIVPTPEDFGSAGEKPTHPELLDTLAVEFSGEMGWSVKSLLRKFVTSATYRQSSAVSAELAATDPDNRLLARGPRQRLSGEMARDAALSASGLLTAEIGGKPVHPPLPDGVWKPFDGSKWITPDQGDPQRYRRSIYTYWKRSIPYPTFMTFDAPSREMCSKRRMPSNTPVQALAVMNDPAFQECAEALARRMKYKTGGDLAAKLSEGYRATTSKHITPDRLAELTSLFKDLEQTYAADPELKQGVAGTPDGAAYTVVASVLLNLDEAITR